MNIKTRALLVVSLMILLLAGFFLYHGVTQYNKEIDRAIHVEEEVIDAITHHIKENSFAPYRRKIERFVKNNEAVRKAFAEQDREGLYRLTLPEYERLHDENRFFHAMDFNLPDGTVFLRVQKPSFYGDNLNETRQIVTEVHESKDQRSGFDVGKHGAQFWVAQPIHFEGKYVGALEYGIEVRQLENALEQMLKREVATVVKAKQWQKAEFVKHGFRVFGDFVLMTRGSTTFRHVPDGFDFAVDETPVDVDGVPNILHTCLTLPDFQGNVIGRVLVFQDISREVLQKENFVTTALLITAGLLVFSFIVLYASFGSLIGRLEEYARKNRDAREDLEEAQRELEQRVEVRTAELAEANLQLRRHIFEREQTEQKLKDQSDFLNTVIESFTHPFYVIDVDTYEIALANEAAWRLNRGQSPQGLKCYSLTHGTQHPCAGDEHPCPLREVKETKKSTIVEHVHLDADGEERSYEIHAYPIFGADGEVKRIIEYNIDVTSRKQAEKDKEKIWAQLRQSQKMEAIGLLAGGVAHDLNNILTVVLGNVNLAMERADLSDENLRRYFDQIVYSSDRASSLLRQLLMFSRREKLDSFVNIDANKTITDLKKMLSRLIGEKIRVITELAPDLWETPADEDSLGQVITNLVVNARDAMPSRGEVTIATENVRIDHEGRQLYPKARGENYVRITVTDTGVGIERDDIEHIFEPFFTTKDKGKGTGLGLSVIYGIVERHRGWIDVYSERGRGTSFKIYLPAATEKTPVEVVKEVTVPVPSEPRGGGELVLLVEDEDFVRELTREALERDGYNVIAAADAESARNLFANEVDNIRLLFCDVGLPDGNGAGLAQEFLDEAPSLKVIIASGYPDQISAMGTLVDQAIRFIKKPYNMSDVKIMVQDVLTAPVVPLAD